MQKEIRKTNNQQGNEMNFAVSHRCLKTRYAITHRYRKVSSVAKFLLRVQLGKNFAFKAEASSCFRSSSWAGMYISKYI